MKRSSDNRSGFTLLEIMMVVTIIALLAGAAIFAMRDQFDVAGEAKVRADLTSLKTALITYRGRAGVFPTTEQGLKALVQKPETEPRPRGWTKFYDEVPRDAWQKEYFYERPGKRSGDDYDIYSAGPDGKPNTADDIGNWKSDT